MMFFMNVVCVPEQLFVSRAKRQQKNQANRQQTHGEAALVNSQVLE
jgi:hypothetical protein